MPSPAAVEGRERGEIGDLGLDGAAGNVDARAGAGDLENPQVLGGAAAGGFLDGDDV